MLDAVCAVKCDVVDRTFETDNHPKNAIVVLINWEADEQILIEIRHEKKLTRALLFADEARELAMKLLEAAIRVQAGIRDE